MNIENWINLVDFTVTQQILFGISTIFWAITYILVEINARKYKYVGIPAGVLVANVAWEFVFSFIFATQLGELFVWGTRIWFLMDVLLFYRLWSYGYKQVDNVNILKYFKPLLVFSVVAWIGIIYAFVKEFTDPIGAVTGYGINVLMSALYILLFFRQNHEPALSKNIAWLKMLGTIPIGLAVAIGHQASILVLVFALITLLLDCFYIFLLHNRSKS